MVEAFDDMFSLPKARRLVMHTTEIAEVQMCSEICVQCWASHA